MTKGIGKIIKKNRLELNLTLEDVAKAVGVSKSTVQRWESGQINNMRRDRIDALSKILQISPLMFVDTSCENHIDSPAPSYYSDPAVAEMAEELKNNPGMKMLFDASRNASQKDLEIAANLLKQLKGDDE